jgi:signal transduction histidine kinase
LLAGERLIGTLSFGTRARDTFSQAELQLMAAVADIAAIAVDRSTLAVRARAVHRQLEQAQENQRRRLSRELHDHMGQHLTAIAVGLKALEEGPPGDWRARVQQLGGLAEEAGREAHRVALELRPAALDDLGLVAALQNYVDEWSDRFGVRADFDSDGVADLPSSSSADTTIYRVVQEALNNVAKHARARTVSVVLTAQNGWIHVVVEDDGIGFDPTAKMNDRTAPLGLLGMHERVALDSGHFMVESKPGGGTSVFARVPCSN